MSSESFPEATTADREYAQIWCDSTAKVLESLHGSGFAATCRPAITPSDLSDEGGGLSALFRVSGCLEGEQTLKVSKSDGVRLAQLLRSQPMDASVAFSEAHMDAFQEICSQFAGLAARSCRDKYGHEVQFRPETSGPPQWKPAAYIVGTFAAPQVNPIQWTLSVSPELHAVLVVLEAAREAKSMGPSIPPPHGSPLPDSSVSPVSSPAPAVKPVQQPVARSDGTLDLTASPTAVSADPPANLNLLLDIELDASLRFGRREMALRDILNLRPGSVIELDRQVQEPAELLVAGRVVARGEVVIVDGSYGLRITEIEHPQHRLVSVKT